MENGDRKRRRYSAELKSEAVRMITSGERKQAEVSRSLGVASSTLSKWVKELTGDQEQGISKDESARIKQLEAENKRLKLEHEILKKAAAFFAKSQM